MGRSRLQVGSAAWITEERIVALQIAGSEAEEFSYSARNELEWLNEHMAGIFNENHTNFAETFKTPGKLRGKTPRTAKKANHLETRLPLSEVFSAITTNGISSPSNRSKTPRLNERTLGKSPGNVQSSTTRFAIFSPRQAAQGASDSGYLAEKDVDELAIHLDAESDDRSIPPEPCVERPSTPPKNDKAGTLADSAGGILSTTGVDIANSSGAPGDTRHVTKHDDISPERQLSMEAKRRVQYADDARSVSDGSSPIRAIVRKSSLNFASLPAREPLATGKTSGARQSRINHLDQSRMSYYDRTTGGKSLGGTLVKLDHEEHRNNQKEVDESASRMTIITQDNKTYTQRLQDQINLLGQSQNKVVPQAQQNRTPGPPASSVPLSALQSTPGAFPVDDEDDDWIEPPQVSNTANPLCPSPPKSHSTDVVLDIQGKKIISEVDDILLVDDGAAPAQTPLHTSTLLPTHEYGKSATISGAAPSSRLLGAETHVKKFVSHVKKFVSVSNPTRETHIRQKQAPTVIRVNTGSQNSKYRLSAAQSENNSLSASQTHQLASKASQASLQPKSSTQSLRGAAAVSRAKVQELATKRRQQEEREAQRRRDAKVEMERKRAAAQEEQRRQDQLKRQDAERQRQQQQAAVQLHAKTPAQRQAAMDKAKQPKAPPPVIRAQPSATPDLANPRDQPAQVLSRATADAQRGKEEPSRPVNSILSKAAGTKRPLPQERVDDHQGTRSQNKGGPLYQANDGKRRRTSEVVDEDADVADQRNIKGPPVRPSAAFKKDLPSRYHLQSGYANASHSGAPNLFKATVSAQHTSQIKTAHPLEMAQISKGTIPFAPHQNASGGNFKTPARPGPANGAKPSATKPATRSSPRFQNGEVIELPEIQTDDDSEDDESKGVAVASWANSPDLRLALMRQEPMDPSQIFGPPAPLNMEEVFNKSKDRFQKFRARTSSANWSGVDRLTEDDIRKDMLGRDKIRRDGGWSYEMSKEML